jgi:hypothetical protein
MIAAGVFVFVALLLCALALLATLRIVQAEMSGSKGLERDGLHPGAPAPRWSLVDSSGRSISSPPTSGMQLIVFADHSLKSFPSVVDGLNEIAEEASELEIVVLLRQRNEMAESLLRLLGLEDVSVVTGSPSLYGRYNVRVMPWMIFVDSSGRVGSSSLVTTAWQIPKLWRLARLSLSSAPEPATKRARRRKVSAGV